MEIWRIYAHILGSVVMGFSQYLFTDEEHALEDARSLYGESAFAVEVTHFPVMTGDEYDAEHNVFYRYKDGAKTVISALPSYEAKLYLLERDNESLNAAIDDLIIAITPTEEN